MIRAVYGQSEIVARFVASIPPFDPTRGFGNCTAIGWDEDGVLIGGVVYHDWNPESGIIELSAASVSKRWLTRKSLQLMFAYPFDQLGCQMVVLRTAADNKQQNGRGIIRIAKAYGFEQVVVPRLFGRHTDGVLHLLTEEAWRGNGFH